MLVNAPDRPLTDLGDWVMVYWSFDPRRQPLYMLSETKPFATEELAKRAAWTAKYHYQQHNVRILSAFVYPPFGNEASHVITFQ